MQTRGDSCRSHGLTVGVRRTEVRILPPERTLEGAVRNGSPEIEERLHRPPIPAHLLLLDHPAREIDNQVLQVTPQSFTACAIADGPCLDPVEDAREAYQATLPTAVLEPPFRALDVAPAQLSMMSIGRPAHRPVADLWA